jgi:hypothetical protein
MSTEKKDSDAIVDISEIKKGEPVSLFIIQVAAPSWAPRNSRRPHWQARAV